jgi:hypothetical protein
MKYLFDGWKMIAVKDDHGQWWKVVKDCTRCGRCCLDSGPDWIFPDKQGGCKYLVGLEDGTYLCNLKGYRPFGCSCNSPPVPEYCEVVLEKTDDPISML